MNKIVEPKYKIGDAAKIALETKTESGHLFKVDTILYVSAIFLRLLPSGKVSFEYSLTKALPTPLYKNKKIEWADLTSFSLEGKTVCRVSEENLIKHPIDNALTIKKDTKKMKSA